MPATARVRNHSVATEQQRQRFNDRCLVTVVGANKHCMRAEPDMTGSDAAKVFNSQIGNLHGVHLPRMPPYEIGGVFIRLSFRVHRSKTLRATTARPAAKPVPHPGRGQPEALKSLGDRR